MAKPLWVFLGKTVTGRSRADEATKSDVVVILDFLGRVLADGRTIRTMLGRLLSGRSGLTDDAGSDWFAGRFNYLKSSRANRPDDLYADICETLFHGRGRLHVVYLTAGEGELHLRVADGPVFGVVNVGDSAALYRMLVGGTHPHLEVEREAGFAERVFDSVDQPDSAVNVVIGARRFIAGWNSWRVSTMGLMHVGVGEGPEVIQTFGRGVRLKGWNMSLKRHRRTGVEPPGDSDDLAELERLYVFGLRSSYMQTFRDLLDKEGIRIERETIRLPVTWNLEKKTDLKILRLAADRKYEHSGDRLILPGPGEEGSPRVVLDLYSRLRSVASNGGAGAAAGGEGAGKSLVKLKPDHTALFDRTRIHDKLLRRKRQRGWHNLVIEPETVGQLLDGEDMDWYELHAPPERLNVTGFPQLRALEEVAVELLTEYAEQFWRKERRQWEHDRIEVVTLDEDDPNRIDAWELSADVAETHLVEDLRRLASHVQEGWFSPTEDWRHHGERPCLRAPALRREGLPGHGPPRSAGREREEGRREAGGISSRTATPMPARPGAVHDPQPDPGARRVVLRRLPLLPRLHRLAEGRQPAAHGLPRPEGAPPVRGSGASQGGASPRDRGGREAGALLRPEPASARVCAVRHRTLAHRRQRALRDGLEAGMACTSWRTPTASAR